MSNFNQYLYVLFLINIRDYRTFFQKLHANNELAWYNGVSKYRGIYSFQD